MSSWPYAIKGGGFHFRQWNAPARKKSEPRKDSSGFKPEHTIPDCLHSGSENLRPAGWFTSKRWDEKHEDVQCRDCRKYSRLPVGVTVPIKVYVTSPESVRGRRAARLIAAAPDPRPDCPPRNG